MTLSSRKTINLLGFRQICSGKQNPPFPNWPVFCLDKNMGNALAFSKPCVPHKPSWAWQTLILLNQLTWKQKAKTSLVIASLANFLRNKKTAAWQTARHSSICFVPSKLVPTAPIHCCQQMRRLEAKHVLLCPLISSFWFLCNKQDLLSWKLPSCKITFASNSQAPDTILEQVF